MHRHKLRKKNTVGYCENKKPSDALDDDKIPDSFQSSVFCILYVFWTPSSINTSGISVLRDSIQTFSVFVNSLFRYEQYNIY